MIAEDFRLRGKRSPHAREEVRDWANAMENQGLVLMAQAAW